MNRRRKDLIGRRGLSRTGKKALMEIFHSMIGKWMGIYLQRTGKKIEDINQEHFVDAAITALMHSKVDDVVIDVYKKFYEKADEGDRENE